MPPRDPSRPQLDFPQLVSDIITQLQVRGQIGLLDLVPTMQPVYLASARTGISLGTLTFPTFNDAGILNSFATAPAAGAVLIDTGQLAAGTWDIYCSISLTDANAPALGAHIDFQHRDAANAVNLSIPMNVPVQQTGTANNNVFIPIIGIDVALNERFRIQNAGGALSATCQVGTSIWTSQRATP